MPALLQTRTPLLVLDGEPARPAVPAAHAATMGSRQRLGAAVKVQTLYNRGTPLIACDHCGQVALDTPRYGWKRWHEEIFISSIPLRGTIIWYHHCPQAVEHNDLIHSGLVYKVDPETAVRYEDWDETDG
jgi:hypothetical protein